MRFILVFVFTLSVALPVGAAERLVFNTTSGPPWTATEEHPGFLNLIAAEIFSRLGLEAEVQMLPGRRALFNANAGIEDGDMFRLLGLETHYPNLIPVPEPLWNMEFSAFSRTEKLPVDGWSSLRRYTVGHVTGHKMFELNLPPGTPVTPASTTELLLKLLRDDKVDMILHEPVELFWWSHRLGVHVTRLRPVLVVSPMHMYVHRRHADLIPGISSVLQTIAGDGTLQAIADRTLDSF